MGAWENFVSGAEDVGQSLASPLGMLSPAAAAISGGDIGKLTGTTQQAEAISEASAAQAAASGEAVGEQRRQFDEMVRLLSPYVEAGTGALGAQQSLMGLGGAEAQQQAISGIEQSPYFQALIQQQEDALLQNASATGGLRGGNLQGALAQFRPQMLQSQVQQQLANLGGLTGMGQASAAGQAAQGMQSAGNISNILTQQGANQANALIAKGGLQAQNFGTGLQLGALALGAI